MQQAPNQQPVSLYIHWPFCKVKCPYCDFNSHVSPAIDMQVWQEAYAKQLHYWLPYLKGRHLRSIFFGGGTPSLMSESIVAAIIEFCHQHMVMNEHTEITLEANPTSVEAHKFKAYKNAGVNRLSLGIQSLNKEDLTFLGRTHSVNEALDAIEMARTTFDRYSFDLIYARPNQDWNEWKKELTEALTYAGNHLSLYQLTIEKGTPFFNAHRLHQFELPDDETAATLYQNTNALLAEHCLIDYEISNYAKPDEECQHNLQYWEYGEYLGIGPGAHSRIVVDGRRYALIMHHLPDKWLEQIHQADKGVQSKTLLTAEDMMAEKITMGLRLKDGITLDSKLIASIPSYLFEEGLLVAHDTRLKITDKGRLLTNAIVAKICHSSCIFY